MEITKQDLDLFVTANRFFMGEVGWFTELCHLVFASLDIPKDSECYVFTNRANNDKLSFNLNSKLIIRLSKPNKPMASVNIRTEDIHKYESHPAFITKGEKFSYSDSYILNFDIASWRDNDFPHDELFHDILKAAKADLKIDQKTIWRKHASPMLTESILLNSDDFDKYLESKLTPVEFVIQQSFASHPKVLELANSEDFYLEKARVLFVELLAEGVSSDLVDEVIANYIKKKKSETYTKYIEELSDIDKAYMLRVGELISYMDTHAAGKNQWNRYDDKRVVAKASVRQHRWVESVFSYLQSGGDLNTISATSAKNAIQYIMDPISGSSILSENHRKEVSKKLFNQKFTTDEAFVKLQWDLKKNLNLEVLNDDNYTYAFGAAVYHTALNDYWNPKEDKMNYYIIGSKYGGNNDQNIYPLMRDGNFVCVGFDEQIDLTPYFDMTEKKSDKALKALGLSQGATTCLRKFVGMKPGDLVAVKASGSPKGKNAYLSIVAIGKVMDIPYYYTHDEGGLGHKVAVEWIEKDIMREYGLGYGATLHRLDKKDHIDSIFNESGEYKYNSTSSISIEAASHPLNQILYGPPGTGKTYATVNKAVAIANPNFIENDRAAVKQEFQRLVTEGKIAFTTFHQSMGYEEFIEGIKPRVIEENEGTQITYDVQPGIFQKMAIEAAFDMVKDVDDAKVKGVVNFTDKYEHLVSSLEEQRTLKSKVTLTSKSGGELIVAGISSNRNILVKHYDEGQPYIVSMNRMKKLNAAFPDLSVIKNIDKEFREVIGGSNSSAYWAVLNAISEFNDITEDVSITKDEQLSFAEKKEIVQEADPTLFNLASKQNYVLIIDEINRGNVSKIFGELITLLEDNKRLGKPDYLKATLPYSNTGSNEDSTFGVQPNLYIIGTMNTADRSVVALDTALRRRFSFTEVMPNSSVLDGDGSLGLTTVYGHKLADMLDTINSRVETLIDRDHTIGHSYFMHLENEENIIDVFTDKIVPLLQEYFYNDYSKIEMVVGSGFIGSDNSTKGSIRFASTRNAIDLDLPVTRYYLIEINTDNIQSALNLMMNIEEK